jgi:RNA polymerase sigma-70 factor (ECF subfamily)
MQELPDRTPVLPSADPEVVLWQRTLAGDGEAFGMLFDRHRDRVFQHAHRLAGNRHDAEDVVAGAFLELWRLRSRVQLVNGSVLPWLLATATNVGLNLTRARRRYQRFLERLPRTDEQPDIADSALGSAIDQRLVEAMRSLKAKDAQLLALVALEGYSVNDAAACLQLSSQAARARLHRSRRTLRELLGHETATGALIGGEGL